MSTDAPATHTLRIRCEEKFLAAVDARAAALGMFSPSEYVRHVLASTRKPKAVRESQFTGRKDKAMVVNLAEVMMARVREWAEEREESVGEVVRAVVEAELS